MAEVIGTYRIYVDEDELESTDKEAVIERAKSLFESAIEDGDVHCDDFYWEEDVLE